MRLLGREGLLRRFWPAWLALAFFLAGCLPVLDAPLVWDDYPLIAVNPAMGRPAPLRDYVSEAYFEFSKNQSWRPLPTLVQDRLAAWTGKSPAALRVVNAAAHLAAAALLAALLAGAGVPAEAWTLAAALFMVHPAGVEPVLCASFLQFLLAGAGILGMLVLHQRGRPAAAAACYAAAMLSAETGSLGLVLALLYDLLVPRPGLAAPGGRLGQGLAALRQRLWHYAAYAAVLAAWSCLRFFLVRGPEWDAGLGGLPLGHRAFYALCSAAAAVRVFFLPVRLRVEYYSVPPADAVEAAVWAAGGLAAVALLGWALVSAWKAGRRLRVFLLLATLPLLAAVSPLVPVDATSFRYMAERWLYLPFAAACAALALAFCGDNPVRAMRQHGWAMALLIVFWGGLGAARCRDWASDETLWRSLVRVYPWSAKAAEGLGEALFRKRLYPEAVASFERALSLREGRADRVLAAYAPLSSNRFMRWESPSLRRWLGLARLKTGDLEPADAHFAAAVELSPGHPVPFNAMAYAWAEAGEFDRAMAWAKRGLAVDPANAFLLRLKRDAAARRLSFRASFD